MSAVRRALRLRAHAAEALGTRRQADRKPSRRAHASGALTSIHRRVRFIVPQIIIIIQEFIMRKFRVYAVRAPQLRVNFFRQVANRAEVRSTPATGFRPIAWAVPAPLYMQRCRHPLRPSRSKDLDGKSGRA